MFIQILRRVSQLPVSVIKGLPINLDTTEYSGLFLFPVCVAFNFRFYCIVTVFLTGAIGILIMHSIMEERSDDTKGNGQSEITKSQRTINLNDKTYGIIHNIINISNLTTKKSEYIIIRISRS